MISCSPAAALEDDDMLEEILLRLPPWPSSLPRAFAVCKRWRGLLTDPGFLRRFGAHHREPPLVGVFLHDGNQVEFTPVLPAPDRIPPRRFDQPIHDVDGHTYFGPQTQLLGCRHGHVLVLHRVRAEVLVCDPITGDLRHVPIPPEFKIGYIIGTVLCAAHDDKGHVNGSCHSTPFKVVLLLLRAKDHRPLASVYSSETDTWGELISTEVPCLNCSSGYLITLVGNVLYWALMCAEDGILEFDLDRQSLDVLKGPPGMNRSTSHQIVHVEDDAVGLVMLSNHYRTIQIWERKVNHPGVPTWVLRMAVETDHILGLPPRIEGEKAWAKLILGYVEGTDGIFLYVKRGIYLVQLKSMQGGRPLMAMEPAKG